MWLTLYILISTLFHHDSFLSKSSSHLCVSTLQLDTKTQMCFAKTKTLQSLRDAHEKNTVSSDLGFNWDDTFDYLSYDTLETLRTDQKDLRVLHLNIRGLKGKQTELNNLLSRLNSLEIIILNETWVKEGDAKQINIPRYKYEGVPRINKKGGGVGFLIRSDLQYRSRHDLDSNERNPSCEQCYIEMKNNIDNVVVGSMYRPPNTNINDFLEIFKYQMNKINNMKCECIIGLDHNLDLLKQSRHPKTQEFLECILDQNLLPTITKPTRISKTSATLIDNILISKKLQPQFESMIIIDDLSDHLPCLVILRNFQQTNNENFIMKGTINNKVIEKIKAELSHVDWDHVLNNKSASDSFKAFHTELTLSINKHAPERLIKERPKKTNTPWMTPGLKHSILKSKKLYEKALLDPLCLPKYKDYMTLLRKCKRRLKLTYYQNKCLEF